MNMSLRKLVLTIIIILCVIVIMKLFFLINRFEGNNVASQARDGVLKPYNELVMNSGKTIIAKTPNGNISITAGEGTVRYYGWEGGIRSVKLWARTKRWYGSLGIYSPGSFRQTFKNHNGITRIVSDEGQQHFETIEESLSWINSPQNSLFKFVYNNEGLVVGWFKTIERSQINVGVWQIYINGKKPKKILGAQDDKIKIFG